MHSNAVPSDKIDRFNTVESTTNGVDNQGVLAAPPSSAGNFVYITECSWVWSVLCFTITSSHTGIMFAFALTRDQIYNYFYSWSLLPFCTTAMGISFFP